MARIWFSVFLICFFVKSLYAKSICLEMPCARDCPSGFINDDNGCPTCDCIPDCWYIKCSAGYYCKQCQDQPCSSHCAPVCEETECKIRCKSGYLLDNNGCKVCHCVDPCEETVCEQGFICEFVDAVCKIPPCLPVAQCVPVCEETECKIRCKSGYLLDNNGCKVCHCVDPCEETVCEQGFICKFVDAVCKMPPCLPVAQCVPDDCLMPSNCSLNCEHGLNVDANGCNICQCFDPCQDVVCNDGDKCQVTNTNCDAPPCPSDVQCVHDCNPQNLWCKIRCDFGQVVDDYGCTLCQCFNPCLKVTCAPGERCQGVAIQCVMAPCPPAIGECVPICPDINCLISCKYGDVLTTDGCHTCKCLPEPSQTI